MEAVEGVKERIQQGGVKGQVFGVVRQALLCGLETAAWTGRQEAELEVSELKSIKISLGIRSTSEEK